MTVWTATKEVEENTKESVKQILSSLGDEMYVDDEVYVDIITTGNFWYRSCVCISLFGVAYQCWCTLRLLEERLNRISLQDYFRFSTFCDSIG